MTEESLYLQFAQAIISRFQEFARINPPSPYVGSYLAFTVGGFHDQYYQGTNYWEFYHRISTEIIGKLEPADNCIREYLRLGVMKAPSLPNNGGEPIANPTYELLAPFLYHELLKPLMKKFEQVRSFRLTPEQILDCYKEFRESRLPQPTTHTMTFNIPLVNFSSESSNLQFGSLQLEPLTLERKTVLWNSSQAAMMMNGNNNPKPFTQSSFMFSGSCVHTAGQMIVEQPLFGDRRRVITALRILKPGAVGTFAYFTESFIKPIGQVISPWPAEELSVSGMEPYTLQYSDLKHLDELMQSLRKNENALRIPLRRFNQCYGRESDEDKIIDCVIALESSLLRGSDGAQLSYKFSLRGAALLARTAPPRNTRDLLDAIYQARNTIVHGGGELSKLSDRVKKNLKQCKPPVEVNQLASVCHQITRDVLRTYILQLQNGKSLDEVNRELDDRIADALSLRADS